MYIKIKHHEKTSFIPDTPEVRQMLEKSGAEILGNATKEEFEGTLGNTAVNQGEEQMQAVADRVEAVTTNKIPHPADE